MASDKNILNNVIKKYAKFIVHMRRQIHDKRFGVVCGAGASRDLGFPDWKTLINRISDHDQVNGKNILDKSGNNSTVTQLLYQKYKANHQDDNE